MHVAIVSRGEGGIHDAYLWETMELYKKKLKHPIWISPVGSNNKYLMCMENFRLLHIQQDGIAAEHFHSDSNQNLHQTVHIWGIFCAADFPKRKTNKY